MTMTKMKTINSLRCTIFVDDPRAISLPGFADGMLQAYQNAQQHPTKIDRMAAFTNRHMIHYVDDPRTTPYDTNFELGMLAAYKLAKEVLENAKTNCDNHRPSA